MKENRDKGRYIKENNISVGDRVLLKRKSTKQDSVYDPQPYKVVEKYGTQIVAERGDERKVRDAQRWKKVEVTERRRYGQEAERSRYQEDPDIGAGMQDQGQRTNQRAVRQRERAVEDQGQEMNLDQGDVRERERPEEARPDITARLGRNPNIILADTVANRPQRQKKQTVVYQAGRKRKRDQRRGRESEDV